MTIRPRLTKTTLIFGGAAAWGLLLISCVAVNRTIMAPAQIAGASYVGTKQCTECHADQTAHFVGSTHSKVAIADAKLGDTGCESCHGPGSLHVKAGGTKATIINPQKNPETCFQCHLEKRGQFTLPNAHPVMSGKVTCVDCHDVHEGSAVKGAATMETEVENCTKCHTTQRGPFVYEHSAMREGCTSCHNPHGSVNQKMLVARDANLCLRCHLQGPLPGTSGVINANSIATSVANHNARLMQGTCWVAGCHETVHGSHTSKTLRR